MMRMLLAAALIGGCVMAQAPAQAQWNNYERQTDQQNHQVAWNFNKQPYLRSGAKWAVHPGYLEGYGISGGAGVYYVQGYTQADQKVEIIEQWTTERGNKLMSVEITEGPNKGKRVVVFARDVI